jgi:methyl-accepting chemotaxis protein
MLGQLSVQKKLNLLSVVFLVPVAFLTYLLINQSMKDIDFAAKESAGNTYLTAARELIVDLSAQFSNPEKPAISSKRGALINALKTIAAAYDPDMNSTEPSKGALESLAKVEDKPVLPSDDSAAYREATDKLRTLISRVGDGSNLILDPDLDSYYAMDIVVVKMTDLSGRLDSVKNILLTQLPQTDLSLDDKATILSAKGQLQSTIDGIDGDLDSGYRGNPDGSLKAALEPMHQQLSGDLAAFVKLIDQAQAEKLSDRPKTADLMATYTKAMRSYDKFWTATSTELDRLLKARIDGLQKKLYLDLGATLVVVLMALGLLAYIATWVRKAFRDFQKTTVTLASGETGVEIPFRGRTDEIGKMAEALETLRQNAIEQKNLQEKERRQVIARVARTEKLEQLSRDFDKTITQIMGKVTGLVEELHVSADAMRRDAESVESQGQQVSNVTQSSSANFQAISAAGEELATSIQEILRQVQQTVGITEEANTRVQATGERMTELSGSVGKIHEVTKLISSIAEQTNLLALNATIEASRAGDAGKGFTVVAGEVKSLAGQTARATEDIAAQVASIQKETKDVAEAVQSIVKTVEQMRELTTIVASAVNQQSAATKEITERVDESARGAKEISTDMSVVTQAARGTKDTALTVFGAVDNLKSESDALRQSVESFLEQVQKIDAENEAESRNLA